MSKFVCFALVALVILALFFEHAEATQGAVGGQLPGRVCCNCACARSRSAQYIGNRLAQMMPTFLGKFFFNPAMMADCGSF